MISELSCRCDISQPGWSFNCTCEIIFGHDANWTLGTDIPFLKLSYGQAKRQNKLVATTKQ